MKVIVADDHDFMRYGLCISLQNNFENIEIDEAVDGNELVEKLALKEYNIILTDLYMPGLSGIDLVKKLLRKPAKLLFLLSAVQSLL